MLILAMVRIKLISGMCIIGNDVGDRNDSGGVNDVHGFAANDGYRDSKVDCCEDLDGWDGVDNNDGDFDNNDDGVDPSNDANCGNDKSKVDCSEDAAGGDRNSNVDGDPNDYGDGDTNNDGRDSDDSDGESNDGADGHKYGVYDSGCLDSVKNLFRYKQIDLKSFLVPLSIR